MGAGRGGASASRSIPSSATPPRRHSDEYHGVVVTYAQVASHPTRHRVRTENRKTLVVFDEIHHGGDAKTWGDAIREAFDDATRRLALTGTPFRSDDSAIPFVTYERGPDGLERSQADHTYGYADALADGVVRPVVFLAYSGESRWRDSAGEEHAARLGEPLNAEQTARAWRTALNPAGDWMPAVIAAADKRLQQKRQHVPDAGGMIIASDQTAARAYAGLLTTITGEAPTVVLSDDPGSSDRITAFSQGTSRWLVAVRMVSEGVDVPRLAVGVYATSASTPLFFAQAIGRYVRSRRPGETASIFLPSVPPAAAGQRDGGAAQSRARQAAPRVAGRRVSRRGRGEGEVRTRRDGQRLRDARRRRRTGSGHLRRLVVRHGDARRAATRRPTTSASPACSTPTQMRDLLRRRQEEQTRQADRGGRSAAGRVSTHGQLRDLRRELNALVTLAHHRTGKPHGWIHNELRRICGGPPMAAARRDQLTARIEAVRELRS